LPAELVFVRKAPDHYDQGLLVVGSDLWCGCRPIPSTAYLATRLINQGMWLEALRKLLRQSRTVFAIADQPSCQRPAQCNWVAQRSVVSRHSACSVVRYEPLTPCAAPLLSARAVAGQRRRPVPQPSALHRCTPSPGCPPPCPRLC